MKDYGNRKKNRGQDGQQWRSIRIIKKGTPDEMLTDLFWRKCRLGESNRSLYIPSARLYKSLVLKCGAIKDK